MGSGHIERVLFAVRFINLFWHYYAVIFGTVLDAVFSTFFFFCDGAFCNNSKVMFHLRFFLGGMLKSADFLNNRCFNVRNVDFISVFFSY